MRAGSPPGGSRRVAPGNAIVRKSAARFCMPIAVLLIVAGCASPTESLVAVASWPLGGFATITFAQGVTIESQHLRPSDSPDYREVASRLRDVQGVSISGTLRSDIGPFGSPGPGPDSLEIWCAADSLDPGADLAHLATRLWGPLSLMPGESVSVDARRSAALMGPGAALLADRIKSGAGAWLYYVWRGTGTLFGTRDGKLSAQLVYR